MIIDYDNKINDFCINDVIDKLFILCSLNDYEYTNKLNDLRQILKIHFQEFQVKLNVNRNRPKELQVWVKECTDLLQNDREVLNLIRIQEYKWENKLVGYSLYNENISRIETRYKSRFIGELYQFRKDVTNSVMLDKNYYKAISDGFLDKLDMLLFSICRLWEFPYFTDQQMHSFNDELLDMIYKGQVNLFNYEKCAYNCELVNDFYNMEYQEIEKLIDPFDVIKDLENNKQFIKHYAKFGHKINNVEGWEEINSCEIEEVIQALKVIYKTVQDGRSGSNYKKVKDNLTNIKDYFENLFKIRDLNLDDRFSKLIKGEDHLKPEELSDKDKGSAVNRLEIIQQLMKQHCPLERNGSIRQYEGNFISGKSKIISDEVQSNIMQHQLFILNNSIDFLTLNPGKGDGMKLRWVGSCVNIFNNILESIANPIKEILEKDFHMAQYNQIGALKMMMEGKDGEGKWVYVDAFGIDFTGYSDYLSRNLLKFCLFLLGFSKSSVTFIMAIMTLPFMVKGSETFLKYKYGTLQGIKFDFMIITIANETMWVIGILISGNKYDVALFCGDDRLQMSTRKYKDNYMHLHLFISICFNCVTNTSKTDSWQINGLCSFCKVTYDVHHRPISGIAPSIYMKHTVSINSIRECITFLTRTGYYPEKRQEGTDLKWYERYGYFEPDWDYFPMVEQLYERYCKDISNICKYFGYTIRDVEKMLSVSYEIPFEWGGLGKYDECNKERYTVWVIDTILRIVEDLNIETISGDKLIRTLKVMTSFNNQIKFDEHCQFTLDNEYVRYLLYKLGTEVDFNRLITNLINFKQSSYEDVELSRELRKLCNTLFKEYEKKMSQVHSVSTKNRNSIHKDPNRMFKDSSLDDYQEKLKKLDNFIPTNQADMLLLSTLASGQVTMKLSDYNYYKQSKSKYIVRFRNDLKNNSFSVYVFEKNNNSYSDKYIVTGNDKNPYELKGNKIVVNSLEDIKQFDIDKDYKKFLVATYRLFNEVKKLVNNDVEYANALTQNIYSRLNHHEIKGYLAKENRKITERILNKYRNKFKQ